MLKYSYCGLTLNSNIDIPELPQSYRDNGGLIFTLESAQPQSRDFIKPNTWQDTSGEVVLAHCEKDSFHWLRFPGLADFQISENTKEISCYPTPETSQETIIHLLLDQVLPRCLAHQGKIILHASAVQLAQGLLIFIGESGAGKSTLAGNFHQTGQTVVSDDCIWIKENKNQIRAIPSYGGLRLWEDSLQFLFAADQNTQPVAHYSSKKRIRLSEGDLPKFSKGIPILALIVLSAPSQPPVAETMLDRLSPREAFIAMMKQTFQLNVMDLKKIKHHTQALGRIVPKLPTFRLSMPHDYDLLSIVHQKILETVL